MKEIFLDWITKAPHNEGYIEIFFVNRKLFVRIMKYSETRVRIYN